MRIIVILFMFSLAILIEVESQEPAQVPPDIEVGEFSTSKFRSSEPITNSRSKTTNKTDTRTRSTIYQEEIRNRNSIENRSRDMLELEQDVMREAQRPIEMFRYRVSLKNTGLKMVKLVIWDYQASYTDDFADASHRLFRCTSKLKPNQSERFEGFSILPPIRVVNASGTAKTLKERIVINRIEYDDGSSWRRSTWQEPEVVASEGGRGNCKLL